MNEAIDIHERQTDPTGESLEWADEPVSGVRTRVATAPESEGLSMPGLAWGELAVALLGVSAFFVFGDRIAIEAVISMSAFACGYLVGRGR